MERGLRHRLPGPARPVPAAPGSGDGLLRSRRSGIAVALAVVFAVAGGAALFSVRQGQSSPSPAAPASASFDLEAGGWGWWRAGEPAPGLVSRIANGYLGECVSGGLPAACT